MKTIDDLTLNEIEEELIYLSKEYNNVMSRDLGHFWYESNTVSENFLSEKGKEDLRLIRKAESALINTKKNKINYYADLPLDSY